MPTSTTSAPVLLLTPDQAAAALAISPRTLWSLKAAGALKHIRIGRCVRFDKRDLFEFLDAQKSGGGHRE